MPKKCFVNSCGNMVSFGKYCPGHYQRLYLYGELRIEIPVRNRAIKICCISNCGEIVSAKGLCARHYARWKKGDRGEKLKAPKRTHTGFLSPGELCSVEKCQNLAHQRKMCGMHYRRWKIHGTPGCAERTVSPRGKMRWKDKDGYIYISRTPTPNNRCPHIAEHRAIIEGKIGRSLIKGETVHHKNGIRDDNRIENLELWAANHSGGSRVKDLLEWAKEILSRYSSDQFELL